jgi:hypothetical protein
LVLECDDRDFDHQDDDLDHDEHQVNDGMFLHCVLLSTGADRGEPSNRNPSQLWETRVVRVYTWRDSSLRKCLFRFDASTSVK